MYVEQRLEMLAEENRQLREKVEMLEKYSMTRFVTPKELAELMNCTVQNVHRKIKTGEILVTRKLGDARIPMCQFLEGLEKPAIKTVKKPSEKVTMAEQIFGGR